MENEQQSKLIKKHIKKYPKFVRPFIMAVWTLMCVIAAKKVSLKTLYNIFSNIFRNVQIIFKNQTIIIAIIIVVIIIGIMVCLCIHWDYKKKIAKQDSKTFKTLLDTNKNVNGLIVERKRGKTTYSIVTQEKTVNKEKQKRSVDIIPFESNRTKAK